MIVKLVNPQTKQCVTIEGGGEVYHEPLRPMTLETQMEWVRAHEQDGYDARRFVVWERGNDEEKVATTAITIPGLRASRERQVALLTNWDAYLCNDAGRTVDRIHRYSGG